MANRNAQLQAAATAVGDGSVLDASGFGTVFAQVYGTFTGTITWEASLQGSGVWVGILAAPVTTGAGALTATAPGLFKLDGGTLIRARISAYTNGSISVLASAVSSD